MRLRGKGRSAIGLGLAAALSGCAAGGGVDPDDAAQRAAVGGVLGATLGAGLGAVFALNPLTGAKVGVISGAALGAATGAITAQPAVTYAPIAIPQTAVIPNFYDGWAPGYHAPPIGATAPPPLPKSG